MSDRVPSMLTVVEAARHLRIGRTKAYALTREWRATGGKTGLPVVDFGGALRVPRHQLELLIGGPLDEPNGPPSSSATASAAAEVSQAEPTPALDTICAPKPRRRPRPRRHPDSQLDLFNPNND